MTDMTPEERKRLRELCENATPGPWENAFLGHPAENGGRMKPDEALEYLKHHTRDRDDFSFVYCMKPDGQADVAFTGCGPTSPENAAFISAAREAVPALLGALDRAEDEIEKQKVLREGHQESYDNHVKRLTALQSENAALRQEVWSISKQSNDRLLELTALRERVAALEKVREAAEKMEDSILDMQQMNEDGFDFEICGCCGAYWDSGQIEHEMDCPVIEFRAALAAAKGKGKGE